MSNNIVIYPVERSFAPSSEVMAKLVEMNGGNSGRERGLADFLGFTDYPSTTSEIGVGLSIWGGEGDTEVDFITVEHFCILVFFAERKEGTTPDGTEVWTSSLVDGRLKDLSRVVGTRLGEKLFHW